MNSDNQKKRPVIGITTHFNYGEDFKSSFRDKIQVPELYVKRIYEAGGFPLLVPCTENIEAIKAYLDLMDGCVFIGGPDYPAEFFGEENSEDNKAYLRLRPKFEFELMKMALAKAIPILGICAGQQLLSIASGGKIIQQIPNAKSHYDEKYHNCRITADGLLKKIAEKDEFEINSYHHQAIDPDFVGKGLYVTAVADDGIVEAIEGTGDIFRLGLQFHAERHRDEEFSKAVFKTFVNAC